MCVLYSLWRNNGIENWIKSWHVALKSKKLKINKNFIIILIYLTTKILKNNFLKYPPTPPTHGKPHFSLQLLIVTSLHKIPSSIYFSILIFFSTYGFCWGTWIWFRQKITNSYPNGRKKWCYWNIFPITELLLLWFEELFDLLNINFT